MSIAPRSPGDTVRRITCSICGRRGSAPVTRNGVDPYASAHGWALCTKHAATPDPKYPDDPPPAPFVPVAP